jgi:hypothetical protein
MVSGSGFFSRLADTRVELQRDRHLVSCLSVELVRESVSRTAIRRDRGACFWRNPVSAKNATLTPPAPGLLPDRRGATGRHPRGSTSLKRTLCPISSQNPSPSIPSGFAGFLKGRSVPQDAFVQLAVGSPPRAVCGDAGHAGHFPGEKLSHRHAPALIDFRAHRPAQRLLVLRGFELLQHAQGRGLGRKAEKVSSWREETIYSEKERAALERAG